jgi:hypothetical protein
MAATELQFRKITFTSCCNENDILEFKYNGTNYPALVYPNSSLPLPSGFTNSCYQVTISFVPFDEWFPLPNVSSIPPSFFSTFPNKEAECAEYVFPNGCPECNPQCYTLYNCDGGQFNTTNDLSAFVYSLYGEPIQIYDIDSGDVISGSWYVYINEGPCTDINNDFGVNDVAVPECLCRCFEIVLLSSKGSVVGVQYIDCDGNLITNSTATKFCSKVYPLVKGNGYEIIEGEECVDGLCPEKCYKLTNCDPNIKEVIYSTLQSLSQYVNTSSVITLLGYEGCWEVDESTAINCDCITVTIEDRSGVTEYTATNIGTYNGWGVWKFTVGTDDFYIWNASTNPSTNWVITIIDCCANPGTTYAESKFQGDCPETISDGSLTGWVIQGVNNWINVQTEVCPGPCDCPVDVTVLQEFSSCETCEPYIAYKLQNCEKIYDVQYTTQDLSEYLGSVIETDCGCFTIQQINYVPPSETLVVIDNTFKRCNDCLSTFYRLTDCAGEVGDIVTTTDLSDYVGGVIKIENCDTCWEVTTTRTFTDLSNVVVVNSYKGCPECGIDLPCVCSKITNLTLTEQVIEYVDCENNTQEITLLVGETSEKICLKKWILPELPEGQFLYAEYFGNCLQLDTTAFVCPQPVFKNNRTVRPGYNTPICTPEKYDNITCRFAEIMYKLALEKRYGITNCCPEEDDRWLIQKELIDLQALKDPNYKCKECTCGCNNNTSQTCNCKN